MPISAHSERARDGARKRHDCDRSTFSVSLMLARALTRGREFAVRAALGASRGLVIRQLLTESLLLGIAAGAIGLLATAFGLKVAIHALPAAPPRADEIGLDFRVLAYTSLISVATGILFGLAPAWRVAKEDPQTALKEGGRGAIGAHRRTLSAFVAVEVAVALVLLTGAGLMVRSLVRLWEWIQGSTRTTWRGSAFPCLRRWPAPLRR